jgi:hypothetical protein
MRAVLGTLRGTLTRCRVCGSSEIRSDEVIDRGLLLLAECPRCEHRWTARAVMAPGAAPYPAGGAGRAREAATAA